MWYTFLLSLLWSEFGERISAQNFAYRLSIQRIGNRPELLIQFVYSEKFNVEKAEIEIAEFGFSNVDFSYVEKVDSGFSNFLFSYFRKG